ncbi:MAG: pentapeptide repeat-containing protein, partial [Candidatus Tisiphia sp.]
MNIKIFKKLRLLIANKKQNDTDFSKSYFHNIKFLNANLSLTNFQKSEFSNVDFWGAKLLGCDFALSRFTNGTYLESADFSGSNLCGVEFTNASYNTAIFSNTNLIGVGGFPATKFPENFNPKEHDMIDIFEIT